jgi:hypothetical protein
MKNQELIKEVFSIIGEKLANGDENYISIHTYANEDGVDLKFEYSSESDVNLIYEMKRECINRGIWFDSGFMTQEPIIEWNLDWSLLKNVNNFSK